MGKESFTESQNTYLLVLTLSPISYATLDKPSNLSVFGFSQKYNGWGYGTERLKQVVYHLNLAG